MKKKLVSLMTGFFLISSIVNADTWPLSKRYTYSGLFSASAALTGVGIKQAVVSQSTAGAVAGIFCFGLGGYGTYYFAKKVNEETDQFGSCNYPQRKEAALDIALGILTATSSAYCLAQPGNVRYESALHLTNLGFSVAQIFTGYKKLRGEPVLATKNENRALTVVRGALEVGIGFSLFNQARKKF